MMTCTSVVFPGSTTPWLGLTQYFFGCVVFTLKATCLLALGFASVSTVALCFFSSKRKASVVGATSSASPMAANRRRAGGEQGGERGPQRVRGAAAPPPARPSRVG